MMVESRSEGGFSSELNHIWLSSFISVLLSHKDKNNNDSYIQYNHKRKRKESQEVDKILSGNIFVFKSNIQIKYSS